MEEDHHKKAARTDAAPEPEIEEFVRKLADSQNSLKAYLLAALGNYDDASEVLQQTNLVLWRNATSFRPGAPFMPWAVSLAKFEVLSFYRDRSRDRHVFSDEVAVLMLQTAADEQPNLNERQAALRLCIAELTDASQEMLKLRYEGSASIAQMSAKLRRTENAIKSALLRIRKSLADCITKRMNSTT